MADIDETIKKIELDIANDIKDKITSFLDSLPDDYQGLQDTISVIDEDDQVSVVSNSDALAQVDHGMAKGAMPNIDRIKDWVRLRKNKTMDYKKFGKKSEQLGLGGNYLHESYIDRITYAVAKKIQDEGITPTWFIDNIITQEMGAEREGMGRMY